MILKQFLLASSVLAISCWTYAEPIELKPIPQEQIYQETQSAPTVYQKQTVVRYNTPTCKNCQVKKTVSRSINVPQEDVQPVIIYSNQQDAYPKYISPAKRSSERKKSVMYDNHNYGISNPLFVLKQGQFSSDTVGGYLVQPKKKKTSGSTTFIDYRFDAWQVAEQLKYGVTDWLSIKLQGGYHTSRPKKSTWKLNPYNIDKSVPHNYAYEGTIGLEAHALNFRHFDAVIGVEGTWGRMGTKMGDEKGSDHYKLITPYAILGTQIGFVTPYLQAGYSFTVGTKKEVMDDAYLVQPGLYIQPSKYFAIHPYIVKAEHEKAEWNLALDFYPYQNLVVGVEGTAVSLDKHPMNLYGVSGHIKMTF